MFVSDFLWRIIQHCLKGRRTIANMNDKNAVGVQRHLLSIVNGSLKLCRYLSTCFHLASWDSFQETEKLCLSSSVLVLPFHVTTSLDSYAWNCRELVTLLTLGESLVMQGTKGLEPQTLRPVARDPRTEPSSSLKMCSYLLFGT